MNYRTVYDDDFGVFIDTTDIAFIERDGYHSITFRIFKEELEDMNKIENLILTQEKNGSYTAYIAEYNLTEQQQSLLAEGVDIDVTQNVTISVFSRGEIRYGTYIINGQCFVYTFMVAPAGFGLVEYTLVGITPCSGSSDAGYEGGGGGGDPVPGDSGGGYEVPGSPVNTIPGIPTGHNGWGGGGSGSGNGNNNTPPAELTDAFGNPVLTVPLLKDPHIKELNKITNQNSQGTNILRNKIDEYEGLLDTAQEETGIEYLSEDGVVYTSRDPHSTGFNFVIFQPPTEDTEILIHLHHNFSFVNENGQTIAIDPIPSDGDITGFAYTYFQIGYEGLTSIVVSRNGLYAFRVQNHIKLNSFYLNLMTYPEKMKKFKSDFYKNVTAKARENISIDSSLDLDTELEKLFIKFIKTHETDMGIGIYKGTEQNGNYIWNNL